MLETRPTAAVAVLLAGALALTGCVEAPTAQTAPPAPTAPLGASPSTSASASPTPESNVFEVCDTIDECMLAALPVRDVGTTIDRGLKVGTFGDNLYGVDYDAMRLEQVRKDYRDDARTGDGGRYEYAVTVMIVLLPSAGDAASAVAALDTYKNVPYTFPPRTPNLPSVTQFPLDAPTGKMPDGSVEKGISHDYPDGRKHVGWSAVFASGPFVTYFVPASLAGAPSIEARDAFIDDYLPEFFDNLDQLLHWYELRKDELIPTDG